MSGINTRKVQASTTNKATVTVVTTAGGNVLLGSYDKDNDGRYYFDNIYTYEFNIGDYAIVNANEEEGYQFLGWYVSSNEYIELKTEAKTTYFKVTKDITYYAYFKNNTQYSVTYINSAVQKNIYKIEIVNEGNSALGCDAPKKKGFDFKGWSEDISSVDKDLVVYPTYKYNIFTVLRDYFGLFISGLLKTLLFSVISVFLSLIVGGIVCFLRISKIKIISFIASAYVEVIRGVPSLLLLLIVYALVPRIELGPFNTEIIACILALFINSSAYMAEIYRSGIQAVDKGQMEAARALGLSYKQAMFKIIVPQAIKNVLPSIGNELIMVIKETSLASQIDAGIGELMSVKRQITSATYINLEPYFIIAFIYFIVTFSLSKVVRKIEKRLEAHE
ncbi:MAG: ABC transporter permease subunit [Bacilli bacterium]|nr:ABC transporter permease subunit [Bacilli bacterium]